MLKSTTLAMCALIIMTSQAHAYIDPGVGSILLQSLVAFIAAASVTVGHFWDRIKSFFKPSNRTSKTAEGHIESSD